MEKVTVPLIYPIKLNGVECDKFTMRRPKVRDMRGAQKLAPNDAEQQELILFANLADVSPDDIEDMDMADYERVQDAYYSFDPYAKLDRKTLKALANRLVREYGMSPTSIDEMTVDDMLWWLTD